VREKRVRNGKKEKRKQGKEDEETHLFRRSLEHDQPSPSARDQLLKHLLKVLRHLLERPLDRLILPRIEHINEFENRFLRLVELLLTREEVVSVLGEGRVLLVGFFVDVGETFERLIDLAELFEELGEKEKSESA
jgi:hypothetical protein